MILVKDFQTETTIPIQGTFDIAKARHVVRTAVILRRWPITFNARVAAAITALGEIIIATGSGSATPLRIEILDQEFKQGISLQFSLIGTDLDLSSLRAKQSRLASAVDEMNVEGRANRLEIAVALHLQQKDRSR